MKFIKRFDEVCMQDIAQVGGKNASLGEMIGALSKQGVRLPTGFAITSDAYWHYLEFNHLLEPMKKIMATLVDVRDFAKLKEVGRSIRTMLEKATMPDDLAQEIAASYQALSKQYGVDACDVAVRSSATAEDLPTASFAGQQETYLNIRGVETLLLATQKCIASLFTDRAIVYRIENKFDHFKVALSVGVQKMIRSDLACSGVAFSLDTETGFKDVVMINASYGLGESIVKGLVIPDEYSVYKPALEKGFDSILKKQIGDKQTKMIYTDNANDPVATVEVAEVDRKKSCLNVQEIVELAKDVVLIERYYSALKGSWSPMDIEWAKDGLDNKLYIVQARPETVHASQEHVHTLTRYELKSGQKRIVATGQSIGQRIVSGTARVIKSADDIGQVQDGDILVTQMTDPDWLPAMKKAVGIVTERGGRTCHAAIVSRELNIPAIVGVQDATTVIKNGQQITLDCSEGKTGCVYDGVIAFEKTTTTLTTLPKLPVELMVNVADPDNAFTSGLLPVDGVGLARLEFIINNVIKIHPMALLHPEKITDKKTQDTIEALTYGYSDKKEFFIDRLSQGVGMIAAAFYPRPVIVRLSDFKTNEYRNLIGGSYFEPEEENPMLGFRGASRYYNERYREAFALECAALKKVREGMGLTNVKVMVPFVRTVTEAERVLQEMAKHGLERGKDGLKIIMMCEIPSNVILIDEFSQLFDGFSIGSNDLTQLTLGVDRDSESLSKLFDERDPAVLAMLRMAVEGAKRNKKHSGICGQAPSDYPEVAQFLIDLGIDSLSLNADSVLPFLLRYVKQ
ncbi:MAG: phosphoenolpyruvate synthase [Candidatus Dependentiae bacterium]|nr:phosphoenolpyruvate synthase [Candidatus Dependentiae bacterium]